MMASRFARRLLAHSARVSVRPTAHAAPVGRRFASTATHQTAEGSSDRPWQIGSAIVFGPIVLYLLTGGAKEKAKPASEHKHASAAPAPKAVEVAKSVAQPVASDPPKEAQAIEDVVPPASEDGKVHGTPALTDSEGTTVSSEEIDASMKQAFKADIPEDAARAEATSEVSESQPAETPVEGKPAEQAEGTAKESGNKPKDVGEARVAATSGEAPKEAAPN